MKQRLGFCILILVGLVWTVTRSALAQETSSPSPESQTGTPDPIVHTVAAGETLFGIAEQYATDVDTLLFLNGLTLDETLFVGQQLTVSGVVPLPAGVTVLDLPQVQIDPTLPPVPKQHVVQGGESLTSIAEAYGVELVDLLESNQWQDGDVLQIGQRLLIPTVVGDVFGAPYTVQLGDTLDGIAAAFNNSAETTLQSPLINPDYLVVGQQLPVVSRTGSAEAAPITGKPHVVKADETLTTIAAAYNLTPIELAEANGLHYPTIVTPEQRLRIPADQPYRPLAANLVGLENGGEFVQGGTFFVTATTTDAITPTATLRYVGLDTPPETYFYADYNQNIPFAAQANSFLAIAGVDSFTPSGLYEFAISTDADAEPEFTQPLLIAPVAFGFQNIGVADLPAVRAAEDEVLGEVYGAFRPKPDYTIPTFQFPLDFIYRTADYGAPRSYAGAPVSIFHSGVDYAAPVNTPIRTVAAGTVVFSDFTELRGNVVIVDHGMGVMTGYYHMEQRLVEIGNLLTEGESIGSLGNTGLSTGAHLHWEVRIRNVPVNGLQWLNTTFP